MSRKNTFIAAVSVCMVLLITSAAVVAAYHFGLKQAERKPDISNRILAASTPTPFPTITPTLIPTNKPIPASKKPSDRALKAAALGLSYFNDDAKQEIINQYSSSSNLEEAVRNLAFYLDNNPERLAMVEAELEKIARARYVQSPPAQVIQQDFPKNCISSTIGNYTYTNCY